MEGNGCTWIKMCALEDLSAKSIGRTQSLDVAYNLKDKDGGKSRLYMYFFIAAKLSRASWAFWEAIKKYIVQRLSKSLLVHTRNSHRRNCSDTKTVSHLMKTPIQYSGF